jgi:hypothetical protein
LPIFNISKGKFTEIAEAPIEKEQNIHRLTEENPKTVFGIGLVATEFSLNDLRVDTLGFDSESMSFVIIELSEKENFSVIDQRYAYLPCS